LKRILEYLVASNKIVIRGRETVWVAADIPEMRRLMEGYPRGCAGGSWTIFIVWRGQTLYS